MSEGSDVSNAHVVVLEDQSILDFDRSRHDHFDAFVISPGDQSFDRCLSGITPVAIAGQRRPVFRIDPDAEPTGAVNTVVHEATEWLSIGTEVGRSEKGKTLSAIVEVIPIAVMGVPGHCIGLDGVVRIAQLDEREQSRDLLRTTILPKRRRE